MTNHTASKEVNADDVVICDLCNGPVSPKGHDCGPSAPDAGQVVVPRDLAEKLQVHLTGMLVASCNCDTKMPDVDLHKVNCRYRQTSEAVEMIDTLLTAAGSRQDG